MNDEERCDAVGLRPGQTFLRPHDHQHRREAIGHHAAFMDHGDRRPVVVDGLAVARVDRVTERTAIHHVEVPIVPGRRHREPLERDGALQVLRPHIRLLHPDPPR